jgi:hypothetical protein
MSVFDVGMENLPNVYIDRVTIRTLSNGDHNIEVTCLIKDHKDQRSWRFREELLNMKVKVALVSDLNENFTTLSTSLDTGESSLFNIDDFSIAPYLIVSANGFYEAPDVDMEEIFYYHTFIFRSVLSDVANANVYAACFIDNLGFENDMFNKYYGPMSSEIILKNGEVNTSSGYFYFPDTNEEYGGPVHFHTSGYMEGSRHRQQAHRSLRLVTEDDAKITQVTQEDPDILTSPAPYTGVLSDDDLVGGGGINTPDGFDLTPGNLGQNEADDGGVGY